MTREEIMHFKNQILTSHCGILPGYSPGRKVRRRWGPGVLWAVTYEGKLPSCCRRCPCRSCPRTPSLCKGGTTPKQMAVELSSPPPPRLSSLGTSCPASDSPEDIFLKLVSILPSWHQRLFSFSLVSVEKESMHPSFQKLFYKIN